MAIDTTDDIAASDNGVPAPGQALGLDLAAIDASTTAPQQLAFIAPDSGLMASDAARFPGRPGGGIVRVSTDATGGQANGDSFDPAVSGNGRFVAFDSFASNLVPGNANGTEDVFVKDLRTGRVTLASTDAEGNQFSTASKTPSISANGRYVAFEKLPALPYPASSHVFVKDLRTGQLTQVDTDAQGNEGNGSTFGPPSISANGRYVAFESDASNLVPGDTNNTFDVFVKDLRTGTVTLASTNAAGGVNGSGTYSDEPALSADGRTVAFVNRSGGVEVKDLSTGQLTVVGSAMPVPGVLISQPSLSADGRFIAFDSFGGTPALPGYSGFITTAAYGTSLSHDVFVKDLQTGQLTLASADAAGNQGNGSSSHPAISPNGRFVAFESNATNLAPGATDGHTGVFVRDLWTGGVSLVDADTPSPNAEYGYTTPSVTNAGTVAFATQAAGLVPGDTNGVSDIFLKG